MRVLRVGSVPYLNAKPLVDWIEAERPAGVELSYAVPSELARGLRTGSLDVAMVSIFEVFQNPSLVVVPGVSIAADGPVKSVRLFSRVPIADIRSVALDTSSLTSANLTRILLDERYRLAPAFVDHPPDLDAMLARCDAGLIIGDLKLFTSPARYILDLGAEWRALTGLPFVYAAWLAREQPAGPSMVDLLQRSRDWGVAHLDSLAARWAPAMGLPLDSVRDYFLCVMQYDMDDAKQRAIAAFQDRCVRHGLVDERHRLRFVEEGSR